MKTFFVVFFALILGGAGGYFVWHNIINKSSTGTFAGHKVLTPQNFDEPFMWGVDTNPSAVKKYDLTTWNKELKLVKTLGTNWIRLVYDNKPANRLEIFDEMVNAANPQGINILLSLDSTSPVETVSNPQQDGANVCHEVSEHFKGRIQYYQVLNEQGGTVIKSSGFSGENESDFDPAKYKQVTDWTRGCTAAIRKNDPNARTVITVNWLHYGYIQMLIRDKIDFDIIGWDWYSDMKMMGEKKTADGSLLTDKIKSFNKPVILAEVNAQPNATGTNQQQQADFISSMAQWAYNSGFIKGFFVHTLIDTAPYAGQKAAYYGLVTYNESAHSGFSIGDIKKGFTAYQDVIKKNPSK